MATHTGVGEELDAGGFGSVIEAGRTAIAQEFQIAERLDAKARNLVSVVAGWYAVVQAIAVLALRAVLDGGSDSSWLFAAVVVCAGLAGGLVMLAMAFSYFVWKVREEKEIQPRALHEMADVAGRSERELDEKLVQHYAFVLRTRRANNSERAKWLKRTVPFAGAATVIALAELVLSLAAVVQS